MNQANTWGGARPGAGRKPKAEPYRPIYIKMTASERERLEADAADFEGSLSDYCRSKIFAEPEPDKKPAKKAKKTAKK